MHIWVIWFGYFQHWWERLSIIKTASFNDWTIENVILPWKPEKLSSPKLPFFVFLYSHSQTGKWTAGNFCIYVRNQLNTTRNSTLNRIHLINFQIVMLRQKIYMLPLILSEKAPKLLFWIWSQSYLLWKLFRISIYFYFLLIKYPVWKCWDLEKILKRSPEIKFFCLP